MDRNSIWLLDRNARPIRLVHEHAWVYRERLHPVMVFVPERHHADLATYDAIEIIAPYHFKGRLFLSHLLGVAVGIAAASILTVDPLATTIMVLTFALSTVLYHAPSSSQFRLARCIGGGEETTFLIIREEDLRDYDKSPAITLARPTRPMAPSLTVREERRIDQMRYGLVASLCGATAFFMARVADTAESGIMVTSLAIAVAFCALSMSAAAIFRMARLSAFLRCL